MLFLSRTFLNSSIIKTLMKKYVYLEGLVTADAAFDAFGKTIEEVFENCALATAGIMIDFKTLKTKITKKIIIVAENEEKLLFNFLDQIIFLKDSEQLLFKKFKVKITNAKQFRLESDCIGDKINQETQKLGNDLKAVTYHNFKLEQTKQGWSARIVLDI